MAGNDAAFRPDQDRIGKAKLHDARRNLRDLARGVRACIELVADQLLDRPHLDVGGHSPNFDWLPLLASN